MNCCLLADGAEINDSVQSPNIHSAEQCPSPQLFSESNNGQKKKKEQNDSPKKEKAVVVVASRKSKAKGKHKITKKNKTSDVQTKKKRGPRISKAINVKPNPAKINQIKACPSNHFDFDMNHFNRASFAMAMSNVQLGFGAISELLNVYKNLK